MPDTRRAITVRLTQDDYRKFRDLQRALAEDSRPGLSVTMLDTIRFAVYTAYDQLMMERKAAK